jgi:hypothetical protein
VKPELSAPACPWGLVADLKVIEACLVFASKKPEGAL